MKKEDLAALGLTETDVLNSLCARMFDYYVNNDESYKTEFERRMEMAVIQRVDEVLEAALTKHVLPKVDDMVDAICLQETNKWGEKRGSKLTFIEYLTQRVDAYIREEVDHNGKSKDQDVYGWSKKSTRIAFLIHEHLQYSIERAMKDALGEVNSSVRKGLEESVKMALANIRVNVETKVQT